MTDVTVISVKVPTLLEAAQLSDEVINARVEGRQISDAAVRTIAKVWASDQHKALAQFSDGEGKDVPVTELLVDLQKVGAIAEGFEALAILALTDWVLDRTK